MVGYAEALTDPSYRGQSLAMTYPMVGNYGVPNNNDKDPLQPLLPRRSFESDSIHAAAVICQDYSNHFSHWEATQSLGRCSTIKTCPACVVLILDDSPRFLESAARCSGASSS
jgi:carbamoylphosphate synthase small subunit